MSVHVNYEYEKPFTKGQIEAIKQIIEKDRKDREERLPGCFEVFGMILCWGLILGSAFIVGSDYSKLRNRVENLENIAEKVKPYIPLAK
jgi:hypothetical protein